MNLNVLSGLLKADDGTATAEAALLLEDAGLSADFAQLLGERFTPVGQQKGKLTAAQLQANDPEAPALSRQQLNQLLASFSDRGQLLVEPKDLDETADSPLPQANNDEDKPLHPVSTLDTATLQALFAMLLAAVVQPLQGNGIAITGESGGKDASLTAASSLLTTLAEKPEFVATGFPEQKTQPKSEDKSVLSGKTNATAVLRSSADPNRDDGAPALKLAAEPVQASSVLQHPVPTPVSSPTNITQPANATVNAPATPQLNAQLGSPEWQQALSQQVLIFHRNGQQSAELRLYPQELGALQITLKLDDNQAQLHITSAHGQVRSAVEAALPHLRHALAESGIHLGQSSVGGESLPHPQHSSQQQSSHSSGQPSYREQHGGTENELDAISAPAALQAMARSVDGVDVFA